MEIVKEGIDLFMSERFCMYRNVAAVIGSLVLLRFSLKFLSNALKWLRAYFLAPWGIGRTDLKKYGPWAIVTGASEGIGRGYALELARQGLNVVIMSRSQDKLDKVANEIKEKYGREVRVVPVDFSKGEQVYPEIAEQLQDLDIGVLVNNVGFSSEYPDVLHKTPIDRMRKIVELNVQSMIHMSHLFLPNMVAKKRGIIVNLSSASAVRPSVMLLCYASTKAFVDFFSGCLSLEYAKEGIIVQNVAPFFVATAMSGIRRSNMIVADAIQYTRAAVATIGILDYTHGCLSHAIQGIVFRRIPGFIMTPGSWKAMESAKAKYLKRKAKGK